MPSPLPRRLVRAMTLWIMRIIGGALLLFGILGMLTPIPFGLIFFIAALMILIPTTPQVAVPVRWARRKIWLFDSVMHTATSRLPVPYRRVLRMTEFD